MANKKSISWESKKDSTRGSKSPSSSSKESASSKKKAVLKESFVEKELLHASVIQQELMHAIKDLNSGLQSLNSTLTLIREHEFVELHKSKWRIIAYQIALGILFAIGTVIGFALFSWATYTFFKDSTLLRQIIDKQINSRSINIGDIRERAQRDAATNTTITTTSTTVSTSTGEIQQ